MLGICGFKTNQHKPRGLKTTSVAHPTEVLGFVVQEQPSQLVLAQGPLMLELRVSQGCQPLEGLPGARRGASQTARSLGCLQHVAVCIGPPEYPPDPVWVAQVGRAELTLPVNT